MIFTTVVIVVVVVMENQRLVDHKPHPFHTTLVRKQQQRQVRRIKTGVSMPEHDVEPARENSVKSKCMCIVFTLRGAIGIVLFKGIISQ